MTDDTRPENRGLDEIARNDRRLAAEAARDAELERPTAAGAGGHEHPQIRHADHVRAADDVDTFERQEDLAAAQAQAAEFLAENAERLRQGREEIGEVRDEVRERTGDVRALAGDTRELRDQTHRVAEDVREDTDRIGDIA